MAKVKVPAAASAAYEAAKAFSAAADLARRLRGGSSLSSYADLDYVTVAWRTRRGDGGGAAASLRAWLESGDVDPSMVVKALRKAVAVALPDDVAVAFWSHGLHGWDPPRRVRAWRFGDPPEGGRSYNFRDQFEELGVSVAGVEGEESGWGIWQSDRGAVWVEGWMREDVKGSDGEPLLVGITKIRKPRGAK